MKSPLRFTLEIIQARMFSKPCRCYSLIRFAACHPMVITLKQHWFISHLVNQLVSLSINKCFRVRHHSTHCVKAQQWTRYRDSHSCGAYILLMQEQTGHWGRIGSAGKQEGQGQAREASSPKESGQEKPGSWGRARQAEGVRQLREGQAGWGRARQLREDQEQGLSVQGGSLLPGKGDVKSWNLESLVLPSSLLGPMSQML